MQEVCQLVDVLLPEAAINILAFSAEPLLQWKRKPDIRRFIDALYASSSYPPYSSYLYKREKNDMLMWSRRFTKGANDPLQQNDLKGSVKEHLAAQTGNIPNLLEDAQFGRATKYVMAWTSCVQSLLEEAGFYSLAHILESDEEIDCSLLLASHLYYKQAVQVLRNFIEETLLPINFCENVNEFNLWKANNYRTPPLRGRDGLVKKLVDNGILSEKVGKLVSDLYGDLNSYIHGSENRLIHKDIHTGSRDGLIFKPVDFEAWCGYLSRAIELGIRLLRINYVQWEHIKSIKWMELRSRGKVLCSTCHNEEDFHITMYPPEDVECQAIIMGPDGTRFKTDKSYPGVISHIYRCLRCGNKTTVRPFSTPEGYRIEAIFIDT